MACLGTPKTWDMGWHNRLGKEMKVRMAWLLSRASFDSCLAYKQQDAPAGQSADRKSTRLNSSHSGESRMPSSA